MSSTPVSLSSYHITSLKNILALFQVLRFVMLSVWWLLRSLFVHTGEDESFLKDLVNRGTIMI